MLRKRVVVGAGAVALVAAVVAGGVAVAGGGDEGEGGGDVTTLQSDRATRAALDATGGGHANSVERDSENGATWEVEVTKPDGETVDVRLDDAYDLVVVESDHEEPGEQSG